MGLNLKHRAVMGANLLGERLFEDTDLVYSYNSGTIVKDNEGLLFTSSGSASWFLFAQATGDVSKFKTFEQLKDHRLNVEIDLEWLDTAQDNAKIIVSLGFYTYPDPVYGIRTRYRDLISNANNGFETHIVDSFISGYSAYPGGGSISGIDRQYFIYKIFLNSPNGGSCRIKRFNVYDLGEE